MNTTAGCGVAGANSVLLASFIPTTLRANSMTAIWGGHTEGGGGRHKEDGGTRRVVGSA